MLLGGDGHSVVGVGGDGHGVLGILATVKAHHIHRLISSHFIPAAISGLNRIRIGQLVIGVAAPGDNGAISEQGQRVTLTVSHTDDLLSLGDTSLHSFNMIIVHVGRSVHMEGQTAQPSGIPTGITLNSPISGIGDSKACSYQSGPIIESILLLFRRIHGDGQLGSVHLTIHHASFPPQSVRFQLNNNGRHVVGAAALGINLAIQVETPTPHGTVITDHTDGVASGPLGQINNLAHTGHLLRCAGLDTIGPIHTQLSLAIGTPGIHTAALSEGHRVGDTSHHLHHSGIGTHGSVTQSDYRGLAQAVRLHLVAGEAPGEP